MSTHRDPAALQGLAHITRDAELAKIRDVVRRMSAIQSSVDKLNGELAARQSDAVFDPARLSGAEMRWIGWADDRLRGYQRQLAALRVEHEEALAAARHAFGRAQVIDELAARHAEAVKADRAKRI